MNRVLAGILSAMIAVVVALPARAADASSATPSAPATESPDQSAIDLPPKDAMMEGMNEEVEHDMSKTGHDPHLNHMDMQSMMLHMEFTKLRPENPQDSKRANELAAGLRDKLAKYTDVKVAIKDHYRPFHPEIRDQKVIHFTRFWYALKANIVFNPDEPTSLLYERQPKGVLKLIGAMYTDRKNATEDDLNARVPLSVARWHRHVNLCFPAVGTHYDQVDWKMFGAGLIATKADCDGAGGRFYPQLFGWMIHVYPWESDPKLVWAK
jgi:hypothetical protein